MITSTWDSFRLFRMYGYYYLMFATFPVLYMETYGFSTGIAGLVRLRNARLHAL